MCLRTEQRTPQIATKDIICYKIIHKDMTSLFHKEFKWEFGKVYHTEMTTTHSCFFMNIMVEQGFHSYSTLKATREGYYSSSEPCIAVKCTIPQGSEYYTGSHGVRDGYTSDKIILNEIISPKELYPNFDFDKYPYKEGDKVIIKFKEDIEPREEVVQNIQPKYETIIQNIQPDYGTNTVDILVSFESKYTFITTKFDGKELKIGPIIHPRLGKRLVIDEIKIKED